MRDRFAGQRVVAGATAITVETLTPVEVALPWGRLFDLTMNIEAQCTAE